MSSVLSITMSKVAGVPQPLKTRVETWEVPGLTGYGALTLGQGDGEFDVISVLYCANNATALTHTAACMAAKGTTGTVVDDFGDSYPNILAIGVECQKRPCIWNGNALAVRVETHWKMVSTA